MEHTPTRRRWTALGLRPLTVILLVVLLGVVVVARTRVVAHVSLVPSGFHGCMVKRAVAAKAKCQQHAMERAIGDSADPFPALARFDDAMTTTRNDEACHLAGHGAGRRFGRGLDDAGKLVVDRMAKIDAANHLCTLGFLHGVAEVSVTRDAGEFRQLAQLGCSPLEDRAMRAMCFHGLGHGLVLAKLPVATARERCKLLGDSVAGWCDEGVVMQVDMARRGNDR